MYDIQESGEGAPAERLVHDPSHVVTQFYNEQSELDGDLEVDLGPQEEHKDTLMYNTSPPDPNPSKMRSILSNRNAEVEQAASVQHREFNRSRNMINTKV